jgi:hypothetical protein
MHSPPTTKEDPMPKHTTEITQEAAQAARKALLEAGL